MQNSSADEAQQGLSTTQLSYKVISQLGKILGRSQSPSKSELKELDKDLNALNQEDNDALVEAGTLELLLRYLTVDQHFDVCTKCLMAMSAYDSTRHALYAMPEGGMPWLADYLVNSCKTAKGEKQIERCSVLCKVLTLYSIDAPAHHLNWLKDMCEALADPLQRAHTKTGQTDAYTFLSVMLPSMWISMGSSLAPIFALRVINTGCMPLLLTVAKDVQRADLKGLPKIIAEKALNLLCACNAEQPKLSLSEVGADALGAFCVETATKSDWVQSQELSLVLLGRMVFLHHALPASYMEADAVVNMLQLAMKAKSPALRTTACCLAAICPQPVFEKVDVEFHLAINEVAEGTPTSVKRLASPTAGGMTILRWGCPLNEGAKDLLRGSKLVSRMAESVPLHVPHQLVELLLPNMKQYVTSVKAAHGLKDGETELSRARSGMMDEEGDEGAADDMDGSAHDAAAAGGSASALADKSPKALQSPQHLTSPRPPNGVRQSGGGSTQQQGFSVGAAQLLAMSHSAGPSRPQAAAAQREGGLGDSSSQGAKRPRAGQGGMSDGDEGPAKKEKSGAGGPPSSSKPVLNLGAPLTQNSAGAAAGSSSKPTRPPGTGAPMYSLNQQKQQQQQQQQQHQTKAAAKAAPAAAAAAAGAASQQQRHFNSRDFSDLNSFIYEIVLQSGQLEPKGRQVLDNLMKGMSFLPSIMNNKLKLDATQGADHDATLRQWADRVRAQAGSLVGMKGPQLDMQLTFSQRMLDEISLCSKEVERQVAALNR